MEDNIDFDPSIRSDDHDISYQGDAAADEESGDDNFHLDDVGALRGPPSSSSRQAEVENHPPRLEASERTWEASEMTCEDWSADRGASVRGRETRDSTLCTEDFVRLKIRVAELESREQLERWHERENIELQERMKKMQEDGLNKRLEAFRVQHFLQERIAKMQKEMDRMRRANELLEEVNQGLLKNQQRRLSSKRSKSPSKIIFRKKSVGEVGRPRLKEIQAPGRNEGEGLPLRKLPPATITFKRRSTVGEMETPRLEGNRKAKTSEVDGLPLPQQPQKITFRRRSTVGEMESPYRRENQEATRNEVECVPPGHLPSSVALPASITFKRRSTVGEMENPHLEGHRETIKIEVNDLPLSQQPREITFRRRSTVGEMESPYLQENQEAIKITFRRKSSVEDVECIYHNKNQAAVKNAARNTPSNITSKGRSTGGEIERRSLKENQDTSKNEAERLPPQKLLSNITFKRRSTVGEMERPAVGEMERPAVGEMERPAVGEMERPAAQDDAECLPFPKQQRRRTVEAKPSLISLCRGLSASFSKRSPGKLPSLAMGEASCITGMTTGASSSNDPSSMHESWSTANAINSQTEMYNRMSSARQRAKFKKDGLAFANSDPNLLKARPQSADVHGIRKRPIMRRAESEQLMQPCTRALSRPNSQRRSSFSIEGLCSGEGSNTSDNDEFDENTMSWDADEEEDGSRSDSSGK